jgi:hypothetical protein
MEVLMSPYQDVLLAWGINGFLTVIGCYLVISAIIARMPPIPKLMKTALPLKQRGQRILLGIFGTLLIFPTMLTIYKEAIGVSAPLFQPKIQEMKAESEMTNWLMSDAIQIASLKPLSAPMFDPYQAPNCEKVESFGLQQKSIRRLKYGAFHNKLYVYVGRVSSYGGKNNIYLQSSNNSRSWPNSGVIEENDFQQRYNNNHEWKYQSSFQKSGDYVDFSFNGQSYRLTVSRIYSPLFGANSIAIDICRLRE